MHDGYTINECTGREPIINIDSARFRAMISVTVLTIQFTPSPIAWAVAQLRPLPLLSLKLHIASMLCRVELLLILET